MKRTNGAWFAMAAAMLGGFSCADERSAATEVVITAQTDLSPGVDFTGLAVRVYGASAELPRDADMAVSQTLLPITGPADLRRPIVVERGDQSEMLVAVRALGPGGWSNPIVEHAFRVRFTSGRTVAVPVFLARACRDSACGRTPGQTCYGEAHGGGLCPGACAAIDVPDLVIDVEHVGDELAWAPRRCLMEDGGPNGSIDAEAAVEGDADKNADAAPEAGLEAGAVDAGSCSPSIPGAMCDHIAQCGCPPEPNVACRVSVDDTGAEVATCGLGGPKRVGEICTDSVQCAAGAGCLFWTINDQQLGWCNAYCTEDKQCGPGGLCTPVNSDGEPLPHYATCDKSCALDADCESGCCLDNELCAPEEACELARRICIPSSPWTGAETPPAGTGGCLVDADCCVTGGQPGLCVVPLSPDGGVPLSRCVSSCTRPADCPSGCCSVPQTDAENARACVDALVALETPGICGT